MKLGVQRRLDRIAGTFLCGAFSLLSLARRDVSLRRIPERILVVLLSEMGSLVLARPMFDHIKGKYPGASIHVLVFEQNREVLDILNVVPPGHILTVSNRSLTGFLLDSIRALRRIRRFSIDTVIDCELFSRISSIYSFLSGARTRAGFHPHNQEGLYRGSFINRPVLYNPYIHISQQFIHLVEALEPGRTPAVKRRVPSGPSKIPPLEISQGEIDASMKRFQADFPRVTGRKLVLLYPGGGLLPIRAWPLEYFCRLAEELIRKGYTVGIIGLEEDRQRAGAIQAHCRHHNCIDLTGYTERIRDLMVIFHFGSLLVTNDGGPGHFASMTPIPAIILYGPETPQLYGPLGPKTASLYVPLSCSPCLTAYNHRNSPCDGDNACLKGILPEEVVLKSIQILEGRGGTPFADALGDL
jgi:ADP-heptose:LPS heptosyltransferase